MTKLVVDLDADYVKLLDVSRSEVRDWFDGVGKFNEELETALDEAQGEIGQGKQDKMYVIVRIRE